MAEVCALSVTRSVSQQLQVRNEHPRISSKVDVDLFIRSCFPHLLFIIIFCRARLQLIIVLVCICSCLARPQGVSIPHFLDEMPRLLLISAGHIHSVYSRAAFLLFPPHIDDICLPNQQHESSVMRPQSVYLSMIQSRHV